MLIATKLIVILISTWRPFTKKGSLDRAVSAKTIYLTFTHSTVTFGILLKTSHLIKFISQSEQAIKFSSVLFSRTLKNLICPTKLWTINFDHQILPSDTKFSNARQILFYDIHFGKILFYPVTLNSVTWNSIPSRKFGNIKFYSVTLNSVTSNRGHTEYKASVIVFLTNGESLFELKYG